MAARNTNRAAAVVTFLTTALAGDDSTDYYVTRSMSEANATGSAKRIVVVRWYNRNPEGAMNINEDRADRLSFSILGLPMVTDDDGMSDECDEIEEAVVDAIRGATAYSVFNSLGDGAYLGWRDVGSVKAPNRMGQTAVEITVEVSVEEDAT